MSREAGKGDKQRPTNHEQFSFNYDNIFKKKPEVYQTTCRRCGKNLWLDPMDVYSGTHTCTPKENP